MDPATMMAIANVAMNMMGPKDDKSGAGGGTPQAQKPAFAPGPLPAINTTDYGAMIKNMIPGQMPAQPMMGMPGMQQMAGQRTF